MREAAYESASVRLRPVLMTAVAMVLGIVPMALGVGDGGEQNAPLGRAVIGGLLFGTPATLLVVPTVFAMLRARAPDARRDVLSASAADGGESGPDLPTGVAR